MGRINLSSDKGFTLIELLIALSLTMIVLGVGYSLCFFGVTSFSRAKEQVTKQQEVRLAHKLLTEEIRYASEVEILSAKPEAYQADAVYIFVDENGDLVKVAQRGKSVVMQGSKLGPVRVSFMTEEGSRTLDLVVGIDSKERPYEVKALILVLNLASKLSNRKGSILRYRIL